MNLQQRIDLLSRLGGYMLSDEEAWIAAKEKASSENNWFNPEFVEIATRQVATAFLDKEALTLWVSKYDIPEDRSNPKKIGIVMAGNIPLVGFHDLLCVFITGHTAHVKASSKDNVLIRHLVETMAQWDEKVNELICFGSMLKGCDAYIATGSNNSAGYFDYYFSKYPHIIRRNRTSIAILTGKETKEELELLADDVYIYFGLGCRNITKLYVPEQYDFIPLLDAFRKYNYLSEHHKYKNNYDYNLALHLLNKKYYMSTNSILLVEEPSMFSPISQLNYEYYSHHEALLPTLHPESLQCIVGHSFAPFGTCQQPSLTDYADGVDTMAFLTNL